jgi:serine/threonine protein phosphatase PrpC
VETACRNGELDWGVAARALPGEERSGDDHFVVETTKGWLLAVADGLGHGPEAAVASTAFVEVLKRHIEEPPVELIRLCHEALKDTRGIAATVVTIDRARCLLSWAGVGNVEGVIRHAHPATSPTEYITMRGGIVGYRIPGLQPSVLRFQDGDTLVMATDGIDGDFVRAIGSPHPPAQLAESILDRYAKSTDDALVLVARWRFIATVQEEGPP